MDPLECSLLKDVLDAQPLLETQLPHVYVLMENSVLLNTLVFVDVMTPIPQVMPVKKILLMALLETQLPFAYVLMVKLLVPHKLMEPALDALPLLLVTQLWLVDVLAQ